MSCRVLIAGLFAALTLPAMLQADPVEAELASLLEKGWGDSILSIRPAKEHYEAAAAQAPGDIRVPLAMALVNVKHRRYTSAEALLKEIIAIDPQQQTARELEIWILMLKRRYPEALSAIDKQVEQFPAGKPVSEAVRFYGSLYGFLDGPAQAAVAQNVIVDHQKRLYEKLSTAQKKEFESARQAVNLQYQESALDQEQAREEEKKKQQAEKANLKEQLSEEEQRVEKQKESVDSQASELERETTEKLTGLEKQMAPLNTEIARLNTLGLRLNREIAGLTTEINILLGQAATTEDPTQQVLLRARADRLIGVRRNYELEYSRADAEARRINAARAQLEAERQQVVGLYQAKMKQLGKAAKQLVRTEKRIAQDTKRASRPATGSSSRVTSLSAKVTALTTYVQYPLDRERQRILDSLK